MTIVRCFDESSSTQWSANQEYNQFFLRAQSQYFNDKLQATNSPVFLNEVYDALGMSRTRQGQTMGWAPEKIVGFGPLLSEKNVLLHFEVEEVLELLPA